MNRTTGRTLLAALIGSLALAGSAQAAAPLTTGNYLIADPLSIVPDGEALIEVDLQGRQTLFSTNTISTGAGGAGAMTVPSEVAFGPDGNPYAIDASASPVIIQFDRQTGKQTVVGTNLKSQNAGGVANYLETDSRGLAFLPGGDALMISPTYGAGNNDPTVFRVNLSTGKADVYSNNTISGPDLLSANNVIDIEAASNGTAYVTQTNATNPIVSITANGEQTQVTTGGNFAGSGAYGLTIAPNGNLIATTLGNGTQAVVQVAPVGGAQAKLSDNSVDMAFGGAGLFHGQLNDLTTDAGGAPIVLSSPSAAITDRVIRLRQTPQSGLHELFTDNEISVELDGGQADFGNPASIVRIPPPPVVEQPDIKQPDPQPPIKRCKKGQKLKKGKCVKKKKRKKKKGKK